MRESKPSLIRHRRQLPLFRHYPDVFLGCEAVSWASKTLKIARKSMSAYLHSLTWVYYYL